MPTVEERVESLESILGQFIVHTDIALRRLEREMQEFKDEMRRYRQEAEKDRKALHSEMQEFKDEMRKYRQEAEKDRKALHFEMQEFKEEMREFREKMDKLWERQDEENRRKNKEWSNLAKKMGTIVEDLIAPALRPVLKKYFNCEVTMEGQRMFRRKRGEDFEIDAIAACSGKVFMIEVRATPRPNDIKEILGKSERFFEFFPEYKKKELIVIFGSITFPENIIKHATRKGVYVMGWREWEYMDILNFDEINK